MRSLVLIAYGAHDQASTAAERCAEQLRADTTGFDEVKVAYYQGEPSLRKALKTVRYTDVTVTPLLLSSALSETVVPRELGLGSPGPTPTQGVTRVLSGRTVHYSRAYGQHPHLPDAIVACALSVCPDPSGVTLLLLCERENERALRPRAEALRGGPFAAVKVLPRESLPLLKPADLGAPGARAVAVPCCDLPTLQPWAEQLAEVAERGDVTLFCAPPIQEHPLSAQLALELAQAARSTLGGDLERGTQAAWRALFERLTAPLRVGEALISPQAGLFDLRHALDEGRGNETLTTYVTLSGLREPAQRDDGGQFRPLSTLRTLPRGWRAVLSAAQLPGALEALYPAAVEESYAHERHALRATLWPVTAHRQSGPYPVPSAPLPLRWRPPPERCVAAASKADCGPPNR